MYLTNTEKLLFKVTENLEIIPDYCLTPIFHNPNIRWKNVKTHHNLYQKCKSIMNGYRIKWLFSNPANNFEDLQDLFVDKVPRALYTSKCIIRYLLDNNSYIIQDLNIILTSKYITFRDIISRPNLPWDFEIMLNRKNIVKDIYSFNILQSFSLDLSKINLYIFYKYVKWEILLEFIKQGNITIIWDYVSLNKNLNQEIVENPKYSSLWSYDKLTFNKSLIKRDKNKQILNWDIVKRSVKNPKIFNLWDWYNLSFRLPLLEIISNPNYPWQYFGVNTNIEYNYSFIFRYPELVLEWNLIHLRGPLSELFRFTSIYNRDKFIVTQDIKSENFMAIPTEQFLIINYKEITWKQVKELGFKDLDWDQVSVSKGITYEDVKNNIIDENGNLIPWNWELLVKNPNIGWKKFKENVNNYNEKKESLLPWNIEGLCQHDDFPIDIALKNSDINWNISSLLSNYQNYDLKVKVCKKIQRMWRWYLTFKKPRRENAVNIIKFRWLQHFYRPWGNKSLKLYKIDN